MLHLLDGVVAVVVGPVAVGAGVVAVVLGRSAPLGREHLLVAVGPVDDRPGHVGAGHELAVGVGLGEELVEAARVHQPHQQPVDDQLLVASRGPAAAAVDVDLAVLGGDLGVEGARLQPQPLDVGGVDADQARPGPPTSSLEPLKKPISEPA